MIWSFICGGLVVAGVVAVTWLRERHLAKFMDPRHPSQWDPEQQVILEDRGDDFR